MMQLPIDPLSMAQHAMFPSRDGRPVMPWPMNMPPGGGGGYQRYREMTIDELLLENRVVFLIGEINTGSATGVIMRLLHLQNQKRDMDINLYINSPGGSVDDTLAIFDTMRFLSCDVATYCIGRAMSGGAIVLASGTKGKRFILPHAKVMIHQPWGGVYGQTSDVKIQAEEILKSKKQLNQILSDQTGQPVERIQEDSERDRYFSAEEAKAYGLVDEVLGKGSNVPSGQGTGE
ncbi:MAG: ATP-dependent Clp protease proteolytic subunit [Phycisphaeraceae bacterium]|nr:ATP-dependent Clp protease proteolytic subunit [Phycisphaeraceae bacterium]